MKPVKKTINWLDIAFISLIFSVIWGFIGPYYGLIGFIISYAVFFTIVSTFFYFLKTVSKKFSVGFDARVNSLNWPAAVIVLLALFTIANLSKEAFMDWRYSDSFLQTITFGGLIIGALYIFRFRKKKPKIAIDERVKEITNKSARNALVATWLSLFFVSDSQVVHWQNAQGLSGTYVVDPINAGEILAVVAVGFAAFIASLYIYRHKANLSGEGK